MRYASITLLACAFWVVSALPTAAAAPSGPVHVLIHAQGTESAAATVNGETDSEHLSSSSSTLGHVTITSRESVSCSQSTCTALDHNTHSSQYCASTQGTATLQDSRGTISFVTVGERCTTTQGVAREEGTMVVSHGTGAYTSDHGGAMYIAHFRASGGQFFRQSRPNAPENIEDCIFGTIGSFGFAWLDPAFVARCT